MKKSLLFNICLILLLVFFGCSMKGTIAEDYTALNVGEKMTARTGDVFFAQRDDPATSSHKLSFDLTIFRLSDREIILKMVQYKYSGINNNGEKEQNKVRWTPLASVKTFTYPLSEKIIRFQGFAFKVLKAAGGEISYQRLR